MKTKTIVVTVTAAIILAGSYLIYKNLQNNMSSQTNTPTDTTSTDASDVLGLTATNPYSSKLNKYTKVPDVLPEADRINKQATIKTDEGEIVIKLFGDEAPLTVSNFIFLAKDHFYDGIIFHRREEGFVIQGGDPAGAGYGGPGYQFEDEPVTREYTRGIVAMANSGPDTNGSQFFIMLADVPLPPSYTIFGEVTKGMDVVDKIAIGDKMNEIVITNL
ncbi:MAG: peptidylprolyl isomerase [Candidatus Dojkabacteria bacterium]